MQLGANGFAVAVAVTGAAAEDGREAGPTDSWWSLRCPRRVRPFPDGASCTNKHEVSEAGAMCDARSGRRGRRDAGRRTARRRGGGTMPRETERERECVPACLRG
jgi:hypothetical protein